MYSFYFVLFVQEMFDSDEAAYNEVKRGRAWGSIVFNRNFTQALSNRVDFGANADNFSLDASEVEIRLDMSSKYSKKNMPFNSSLKRSMKFE